MGGTKIDVFYYVKFLFLCNKKLYTHCYFSSDPVPSLLDSRRESKRIDIFTKDSKEDNDCKILDVSLKYTFKSRRLY